MAFSAKVGSKTVIFFYNWRWGCPWGIAGVSIARSLRSNDITNEAAAALCAAAKPSLKLQL